jgi:hypothetical protein
LWLIGHYLGKKMGFSQQPGIGKRLGRPFLISWHGATITVHSEKLRCVHGAMFGHHESAAGFVSRRLPETSMSTPLNPIALRVGLVVPAWMSAGLSDFPCGTPDTVNDFLFLSLPSNQYQRCTWKLLKLA